MVLPLVVINNTCFFIFKQKTAYEMRICYWSSDVGSSDLLTLGGALSLSCGRDWTEDTFTRAFIQSQPIDQRDKETGARKTIDARDNFERVLTHTMDRRCWAALMEQLGFDQLLDQQARKEFHDGLQIGRAHV